MIYSIQSVQKSGLPSNLNIIENHERPAYIKYI